MKISINWLREYINTEANLNTICNTLTNIGLEVESTEECSSNPLDLSNFCVGEVLSCQKHPNADKLQITSVDVGESESLSIVCGANNVQVGMKVAVARIGAQLLDKEGNPFAIQKSKIRDIYSFGMLCSETELKIGNDNSGILSLDKNLKVGTKLTEIFPLYKDTTIEIGLTPNRMDAMSHYGVARDLHAALSHQKIMSDLAKVEVEDFQKSEFTQPKVEVLSPIIVERYMGVCLKNIEVKASPDWLQNKLKSIGINPKNNVVDATNFVMHALGQPLHAFDLGKVDQEKILVRNAKDGEELQSLDGGVLKLSPEDLVIANTNEPMCLAGIMGGLKSGVENSTTSIFLEAAVFDSKSVRKSSKSHLIHSDSSFRFERGVDSNFTPIALNFAIKILKEISNAELFSGIFDFYPKKRENAIVEFDLNQFSRLTGIDIPKETTIDILRKLDFEILKIENEFLQLAVPTYRMDVTRAADVAEEILRIFGYDKVSIPQKMSFSLSNQDLTLKRFALQEKISHQLNGYGFSEAINSSLISSKRNSGFTNNPAVSLLNPLSQDLAELRQSLIPGLLENLSYNSKRQQNKIALFEWGKVYAENMEKPMLSLVYSHQKQKHWVQERKSSVFFELKSVLEALFRQQKIDFSLKIESYPNYKEALSFSVYQKEIAKIGLVSDDFLTLFQIKKIEAAVLELDFDAFFDLAIKTQTRFSQLPKYPFVTRDLSMIVDEQVTYEEVKSLSFLAENQFLRSVSLFDVYQGEKIESGKKSYALSFVLQNPEATLSEYEIENAMEKISKSLESNLKAEVRSE